MIYNKGPSTEETTTAQHTTTKIHHIENITHTPSQHPHNTTTVIL